MDINIVEQKLLTLEGGRFQKLCAALFSKKYPNCTIQKYGGSPGSDKTTKGHPDILLKKTDRCKFILIECTTKAGNLNDKIKSDIEACIDATKTGIKPEMIEEIVFAI